MRNETRGAERPEPHAARTVAALTEHELIERIHRSLPPPPPWLLVGIGDDAAVVEPERNRVEVMTTDALVEGVHFDRAFTPPDAIGHRALAANLSDLAAMGATPRLALLSMALPHDLPLADFDGVVAGITALALRHRLHIAGGNLTRSPGPLIVDMTVVGSVKRRQALTRSGARPGDEIYVTGTVGAAAAGLGKLPEVARSVARSVASHQSSVASPQSPVRATEGPRLTTDDRRLMTAFLFPEPRVRMGMLLSRNRAAAACMDLSDGLADAVRQVAQASGVGAIIDADAVPIDAGARGWFEARGRDALLDAIAGGDDYELLVAVRPRTRSRLAAAIRHGGVPLTRIGAFTAERELIVRRAAGDVALPSGYSHFR
ncbi:MAG: thiamine-phosphate kinase [Acidobacteria bacterium]|nr:thiamine-phosphate kinase [Acidobacteriota bacterium]